MAVRYKNKKTGHVSTYAQPMPRLEASEQWTRLDEATRPDPSDLKAAWADYARSVGVDVEGLSKDEIIKALNG